MSVKDLKAQLIQARQRLYIANYALDHSINVTDALRTWQTSKVCEYAIDVLRLEQLIEQAETIQALNWLQVPHQVIGAKFYV